MHPPPLHRAAGAGAGESAALVIYPVDYTAQKVQVFKSVSLHESGVRRRIRSAKGGGSRWMGLPRILWRVLLNFSRRAGAGTSGQFGGRPGTPPAVVAVANGFALVGHARRG